MRESREEWTLKTLKEHFEKMLEERELRYLQRFDAEQSAIQEFKETITERFEQVNKFRETLKDQQGTLLPRTEYDRAHTDLVHLVQTLTSRMDKKDGEKTGSIDVRGWIFGSVGVIVGVIGLVYALLKR